MQPVLVDRLRRSFEHPEHWAESALGVPAARAQAMLRSHVVSRLDDALAEARKVAMLVKGEGLARTVYPAPWMRPMGDIDVLVAEDDAPVVLAALSDGGFERVSVGHHRPRTQTALNETIFELPVGRGAFVVEVHTALDKVFPRSIPYADVMIRSSEATARLRVPSREDHLLMVALHAAVADFDHPVGWLDLHLLLAGPLDFELIAQRANDWELSTALYVALHGLRRAGSDRVPPQLLEAVRPGILRRAWLRRYFDHRHFPMHAGDRAMGLSWAWRQTALRDDTWRWLIGCGRYGGLRVLERASRAMKSASAAMPSNRRG